MSLVFPQKRDLKALAFEAGLIVVARVDRLSNEGQFFHVRVEQCLKGDVAPGAGLEIHPAGYAMGCQVAESMATTGMSVSFAVPLLEGKAPEIEPGKSYLFFLHDGAELAAMNGWREASSADEIRALL